MHNKLNNIILVN